MSKSSFVMQSFGFAFISLDDCLVSFFFTVPNTFIYPSVVRLTLSGSSFNHKQPRMNFSQLFTERIPFLFLAGSNYNTLILS